MIDGSILVSGGNVKIGSAEGSGSIVGSACSGKTYVPACIICSIIASEGIIIKSGILLSHELKPYAEVPSDKVVVVNGSPVYLGSFIAKTWFNIKSYCNCVMPDGLPLF